MNKKDTEAYINELLRDCNSSSRKLDRVAVIRDQLVLPLCGHRKTVEEAFQYAKMLSDGAGSEGMTVLTAVGVVINTIRQELQRAMQEDSVDD